MDQAKPAIVSLIKEFKREITKQVSLDKLILFGSFAKGSNRKSSDVDLLLVSKDFRGKKYFKRAPSFYLMWDYPYDVDIVCLTPEELLRRKKEIGIIKNAVSEGIEI